MLETFGLTHLFEKVNHKKSRQMSSQKIVENFQNNDTRLLGALYKSQFPKLKRFVLANKGSEEQAKDVFQEAFIITWENVRKGVFVPNSNSEINGYLHRVAKNKWIDFVRSAGFKKTTVLENYHDKMEEAEENSEYKFLLIEKGLKTLKEKCRDILKRFYFQKQSMAEIAEDNGWTEQTARNNKYRCIQQLRSEMKRLKN